MLNGEDNHLHEEDADHDEVDTLESADSHQIATTGQGQQGQPSGGQQFNSNGGGCRRLWSESTVSQGHLPEIDEP